MSNIIPANFGQVSTKFAQVPVQDDLSSGIQSSFGLIGYKGKVWSIRYRGNEIPLMRDDGDGPRGSIEVVILKSSQHVSKIWYEHGYVEGSNSAPDCFSNNGVTPEPTSAKRQSDTCALCPHNQWGSRVTPAGKAGKACSDSKRLAVVPELDIMNEAFGGPMLLRVPAASLQDLAGYGQKMRQMGYPYYAVATRIKFDPTEAYPKFTFGAIRPLNDQEADQVLAIRDGHTVERILSENEFATSAGAEAAPTPEQIFEHPPEKAPQQAQSVQQTQQAQPVQQAQQEAPAPKANPFAAAAKQVVTPEVTEQPQQTQQTSVNQATGEPATPVQPSGKGTVGNPQVPANENAGTATSTAPAKSAEPTHQKPVEAMGGEQAASPSNFELDLDDELAKLLG